MAGLKAYITLKVTDKHGKTVSEKTEESKSFVIGFLGLILGMLKGMIGGATVKDTLNSDEIFPDTANANNLIMCVKAADNVATFGMLVGTGTTAPTNTDYIIETLIAHGDAATQLNYGPTGFVNTAEVGANVDLQFNRTFVNASGGTITVQEVAVYAEAIESGGVTKRICIIRDVTGGVAVTNGQTLTVTYTFRTTV